MTQLVTNAVNVLGRHKGDQEIQLGGISSWESRGLQFTILRPAVTYSGLLEVHMQDMQMRIDWSVL